MEKYRATIISVNYYSSKFLHALESKLHDVDGIELIVVDNSGEYEKKCLRTNLIRAKSNLGFGVASNLGASSAKSKVLIFLNPDASISLEALNSLVDRVYQIGSCIIGPVVRDGDNLVPTLWNRNFFGLVYRRGYISLSNISSDIFDVLYVSGACMAIDRKSFFRLNGFCPSIFLYAEDLDLCCRARNIGVRVGIAPSIEVLHKGGESSNRIRDRFKRLFRSIKGHYVFLRKNHGAIVSFINSIYLASGVRW